MAKKQSKRKLKQMERLITIGSRVFEQKHGNYSPSLKRIAKQQAYMSSRRDLLNLVLKG